MRGLQLRVRLAKLVRGPRYAWPRLCAQASRPAWLQYNVDAMAGVRLTAAQAAAGTLVGGHLDASERAPLPSRYRAYSESSEEPVAQSPGRVGLGEEEEDEGLDFECE